MASGKSREVQVDVVVDATKATKGGKQAEKALGDLEGSASKAGKSVSLSGIATDELGKKLGNMASVVPGGEKAVEGLTESLGASGMAAGVAAGAMVALGIKAYGAFSGAAQDVLKFERVAGTTAEESGRWIEAFDDYGISASDSSVLVGKFAKVVGTTPQVLNDLGVAIAHNKDGTVNLSATMQNAAEAFSKTTDEAKRAEIGSKLFGKQWQSMIPILDQGAAGLKKSFDGVATTKLLSQEQIDQAEKTRLALDQVKDVSEGLMRQIGAGLAPTIAESANGLTNLANAVDKVAGGGGTGGIPKLVDAVAKMALPIDAVTQAGKIWAQGLDLLQGKHEEAAKVTDREGVAISALGNKMEDAEVAAKRLADAEKAGALAVKDAAAANNEAARETKARADAARDAINAVLGQVDADLKYNQSMRDVAAASKDVGTKTGTLAEQYDALTGKIVEAAKASAAQAGLKEGTGEWADFTSQKIGELAGQYAAQFPGVLEYLRTYTELLRQAKIAADMLSLGAASAPGYGGVGGSSKGPFKSFNGPNDPQNTGGTTIIVNASMLNPTAAAGVVIAESIAAAQRTGQIR
jgi:hypothetical protein